MRALGLLLMAAWLASTAGCARRVALDPEMVKARDSTAWTVISEPQAVAPAQK